MRRSISAATFSAVRLLGFATVGQARLPKAEQRSFLPYCVVDTGQTKCYDNLREIDPPQKGQPFYGQDAQYSGPQPSYKLSADGLTVYDTNTGLTWQRSPDTDGDGAINWRDKLALDQARAWPVRLNRDGFGGFRDWRLPSIKELYSLITFSGIDLQMPGGRDKTFFVQFVRGNQNYGHNDFHDNGDDTITDRATALTWSKTDSGQGLTWEAALAWVEARNAEKYLGHNDWRLPHAKELQSLVDYTRSPDTTGSPALQSLFRCIPIRARRRRPAQRSEVR